MIVGNLSQYLAELQQLQTQLIETDKESADLANYMKETHPSTSAEEQLKEIGRLMSSVIQNASRCFSRDQELQPKKTDLFDRVSSLDEGDLKAIQFYDPELGHQIQSIDSIAQELMSEIEAVYVQNGVLLQNIKEREADCFAHVDKKRYSLLSCGGNEPSWFAWSTSGVKIGAFREELEKTLPATQAPWEPVTRAAREVTSLPISYELQNYQNQARLLQNMFKTLRITSKRGNSTYMCATVTTEIEAMKSFILRVNSLKGRSLSKSLRGEYLDTLMMMKRKCSDLTFVPFLEKVQDTQKLYQDLLPKLTPKESLKEETLRRIAYLDPTLKEKAESALADWHDSFHKLESNALWLSSVPVESMDKLKQSLTELTTELSA